MNPTVITVHLLADGLLVFGVFCVGWMALDIARRAVRRARDLVR